MAPAQPDEEEQRQRGEEEDVEMNAAEEAGDGAEEEEEEDDEDEDEEEGSEEGSEEESSEEEEDEERPRQKRKFQAPPPREMPARTTRGLRMGNLMAEGEEGDEDFWNQEFFAEEEADEIYATESEPEDRFDADFGASEDEAEDDKEAAEDEARAREPKKKTLRPPGYTAKRPPKPKPKVEGGEGGEGGAAAAAPPRQPAPRRASLDAAPVSYEPRAVRDSTRQKVEEAEGERRMQELLKPRRVVRPAAHRALTQGELLAEAAKTEIENAKSLQQLVAMEEESKRRAAVKRSKYAGPMLRLLSRGVEGEERTTLEVRNMQTPPDLQPRRAPPPPAQATCVITGLPAKFRDPQTRLPYATREAFQELRRRAAAPQAFGYGYA